MSHCLFFGHPPACKPQQLQQVGVSITYFLFFFHAKCERHVLLLYLPVAFSQEKGRCTTIHGLECSTNILIWNLSLQFLFQRIVILCKKVGRTQALVFYIFDCTTQTTWIEKQANEMGKHLFKMHSNTKYSILKTETTLRVGHMIATLCIKGSSLSFII